jgi:hypothetical protein
MAAILLLGLSLPVAARDWRTPSGDLVTTGMSKGEVLARAGPPTLAEDLGGDCAEGPKRSAFYYIVGSPPNRTAVTLGFRGTRLVDIDVDLVR